MRSVRLTTTPLKESKLLRWRRFSGDLAGCSNPRGCSRMRDTPGSFSSVARVGISFNYYLLSQLNKYT